MVSERITLEPDWMDGQRVVATKHISCGCWFRRQVVHRPPEMVEEKLGYRPAGCG